MKYKLIDIIKARDVIYDMMNQEVGANLAYQFAKFIHETEYDAKYYSGSVSRIMNQYNVEMGADGSYVCRGDVEAFEGEIAGLGDTDADDPGVRISLSEMSKHLKVSMKQVYPLLNFIKED